MVESTAQSNLAMSLKGDLDSTSKEYNQALRESQLGDSIAAGRAIDLQAQISSIRDQIKNADTASVLAEQKENEESAKKEEDQFKKQVLEKQAQENISKSSDLKFLDDDQDVKTQAVVASAQSATPVSAQVSGLAKTEISSDDKHENKAVSSSGQAST